MKTPRVREYLEVMAEMLTAREAGDEAREEELLDRMDALWYGLSAAEIDELESRGPK